MHSRYKTTNKDYLPEPKSPVKPKWQVVVPLKGRRIPMKAQTFTDILKNHIKEEETAQEEVTKSTEEPQTFNIMKTDDDKRLIFGWASVAIKTDGEQVVDHQNDMLDPEDLEEAVYSYVLNFRDGGEEHIPNLRKKARMVESCMFTKEKMQAMGIPEGVVPEGWWIGFYVDDDDAWAKVKDGTYQMFSIEGQGVREEVDDDEEVKKNDNIEKFNPHHDERGRFASASGSGTAAAVSTPVDEDANPEYRYHSTSFRNARNIQDDGVLKPSTHAEYGEGVYFAPNVEGTKGWTSEENEQVHLRVRHQTLKDQYEYDEFPEQGWTENKGVSTAHIEIKVGDQRWINIDDADIRDDEVYEW